MNGLVSIIVPIYNVEQYLDICLSSIEKQSYQNWEAILVNDGSTDNSKLICQKFVDEDPRFKYYYQANAGLSGARNFGLDNANGDYVIFVDSDDYLDSDALNNLLHGLVQYNADMIIGSHIDFYGNGFSSENCDSISKEYKLITCGTALDGLFGSDHMVYGASWGKLYKRTIFNNIRFPIGKAYEDIVPITRIYLDVKPIIVLSNIIVYYYRQRQGSIVRTPSLKNLSDSITASEERTELLKKDKSLYLKSRKFHLLYTMNCYRRYDDPSFRKLAMRSFNKYFYKIVLFHPDKSLKRTLLSFRIKTLFKL